MTSRADRQHLLAQVEERLAELYALLVLARRYHAEQREMFDQRRAELPSYGCEELQQAHERVVEHVDRLAEELGVMRPLREYVDLVVEMGAGKGQCAHMEKWRLKRLLRNYDACVPLAALLPEHTQMSMDPRGVTPAGVFLEVRIVEASVFEDMCAEFNRAWRDTPLARRPDASRIFVKECTAARRASVAKAVDLVEAYLNSLAFDSRVAHADDPPSDDPAHLKDLDWILERNRKTGGRRWVKLHDKLVHYPRILRGKAKPLLDENNCKDLDYFVKTAKAYRDALAHPGPDPDEVAPGRTKVGLFWRLSVDPWGDCGPGALPSACEIEAEQDAEWTRIVDTAVRLLRTLETCVHGSDARLFWLRERTADGLFPPAVFD